MPGLSHSIIPPLRYIHTEFQYRLPADFEFLNSRCRTRNQIREFKKLAAVDKTGAARWLKFCATGGTQSRSKVSKRSAMGVPPGRWVAAGRKGWNPLKSRRKYKVREGGKRETAT